MYIQQQYQQATKAMPIEVTRQLRLHHLVDVPHIREECCYICIASHLLDKLSALAQVQHAHPTRATVPSQVN